MSATTIDVYVASPPVVNVTVVSDPVFEVLGVLPTGPRGPAGPTGATGATGPAGPVGASGEDGEGVPTGGTAGQVLTKDSGVDFDTSWQDPAGAGLTQEQAEDITAALIDDNSDLDWTYDDATPSLVAVVKPGAITAAKVAADVATQAELDAEAALARNADNLTSGTVAEPRIASTIARDSEVSAAVSASEAGQVRDGDAAGGVLSGTYPNPGFAADMATQAELDAGLATKQPLDADLTALAAANNSAVLAAATAAFTTADETKLDHLTVTQAVDLDTIEARVNSLDAAVVLRGNWDASAGTFPGGGTAQAGDSYIVTVAGTVDSVAFSVGDRIVAITDNASTGTYAANWLKLDYTDAVLSVDGQTGAVSLASTYQPLDADLTSIAAANNGAVLAATTASFTTADETKLDGIEAGAQVNPTTEVQQDLVGAMFSGNTETGIAATYDDTNGKVDLVAEVTQSELDAKADDSAVVHDTGDETIAGVKTFSSDPLIPDEAYDATNWNGVLEPPTKNAVRDKIETLAPLASPALTGNPTAPTPSQGDNDTSIATTAYVQTEAGLLVPKSLFDANTMLYATTDNTPAALTVGASTFVGRKASGDISAMTPAEATALLVTHSTWTPTVTAGSGTFTSVSGTGRYSLFGDLVIFNLDVTITTNGSAAASVIATLPFTSIAGHIWTFSGREDAATGNQIQGKIGSGDTSITMWTPTNTYPGASGRTLRISGFYRKAA